MDTKQLLLNFTNITSIPGVDEGINHAAQLLQPFGKVAISPLGDVICTVKEPSNNQPHILLDAHLDEIGLIVTYIEDNGFVRVAQIGGTDPRLLAASSVTIHGSNGKISGVVCSTPPHLSVGDKKDAQPADKIFIDTGLTNDETKEQISPGDRVSFTTHSSELLNNLVSGKAMDDHAGCVCLLKALECLGDNIPCGLTVMFSTMEEIGGMGAKVTSYGVDPTHALVVDVSFGDTPDSPKHKTQPLGSGVMIGHAPILSHKISKRLEDLAKENDIPFTVEVMGSRTGTNSDSVATTRSGVPTALLSIPLRYMHTPIETVSIDDVENTGRLIAAWVKSFSKEGK